MLPIVTRFTPSTLAATPIIRSMNGDQRRLLQLCSGRRMPQEVCSLAAGSGIAEAMNFKKRPSAVLQLRA
jgi:hypothetical protein